MDVANRSLVANGGSHHRASHPWTVPWASDRLNPEHHGALRRLIRLYSPMKKMGKIELLTDSDWTSEEHTEHLLNNGHCVATRSPTGATHQRHSQGAPKILELLTPTRCSLCWPPVAAGDAASPIFDIFGPVPGARLISP